MKCYAKKSNVRHFEMKHTAKVIKCIEFYKIFYHFFNDM